MSTNSTDPTFDHQQVTDELLRSRFGVLATGHDDTLDTDGWVNLPDGDMLSSLLNTRHKKQHAPVYLVAGSVTVDNHGVLTLPISKPAAAAKCVKNLHKAGMIGKDTRTALLAQVKQQQPQPGQTLRIPLAVTTHLAASKERGQVLLFVDEPMTWKQTLQAADALAEVVDPSHRYISERSGQWIARVPQPPKQAPSIASAPAPTSIFPRAKLRRAS